MIRFSRGSNSINSQLHLESMPMHLELDRTPYVPFELSSGRRYRRRETTGLQQKCMVFYCDSDHRCIPCLTSE